MYSGIIRHQGKVETIDQVEGGGRRLRIESPQIVDRLENGSSVNVDGVCLTVTQLDDCGFGAEAMPQTLELTTVGEWAAGKLVNIEPSLRLGDELGGHLLYGHVDGVAEIIDSQVDGNARLVTVRPAPALMKLLAPQGSVALDGVSLTVVDLGEDTFTVSLIPETLARTTWQSLRLGDRVNLEADMLMKYVKTLWPNR